MNILMQRINPVRSLWVRSGLALSVASVASIVVHSSPVKAAVTNGGFESGLSGWTVVDQANGSGSWFLTPGTTSPLSAYDIPLPSEGSQYSVTDQSGPGSHVLFQDITLATGFQHTLSFDWFAQDISDLGPLNPGTMSYSGANNQHFRVDLVPTSFSDWFGPSSTAGILANILAPVAESNPVLGFKALTFDLTPWSGSTVRLAFREVDNRSFFHAGVDRVGVRSTPVTPVPEPVSTLGLVAAIGGVLVLRRDRQVR